METFMKLFIDFFLAGKRLHTHFPALQFKALCRRNLRNKRLFFLSSPITWASWGKVFQTAQPNLSPFAYSECPGPAACPWWRLGRCQDVVLFPCSSKFIQKPLLAALWENVTKISPNPDFITSLICSILCIERTQGSNLGDCNY